MSKNTNICRIPTSLETRFFKYWFEFLEPFHKLTGREIDVITSFLKQRYLLSKVIQDEEILDKVWGNEVVVGGSTIDVHIRKLREKIGDDFFKTIKGVGYKIEF